MKKKLLCLITFLVVLSGLTACGKSGTGEADISSDWKLVEMTVSGTTSTYDDTNRDIYSPRFESPDGKVFTFTLKNKAHTGTIEKSGDKYILNFNDSNRNMEAVIKDNQMTLTISGSGSTTMIFEAD